MVNPNFNRNHGTDVYYNGVWLRNCLTKQFDQTVEYDESGTDRLYTKFNITVECLVSEDIHEWAECHGVLFERNFNNLTAQEKMSAVHGLLSVPRAQFEYYQGGVVLVAANSQVTTDSSGNSFFGLMTDLANGPKPRAVSIQHVIANKCYRITFSIELALLICGDVTGPSLSEPFIQSLQQVKQNLVAGRALLSNRFSIDEVRDGSFYNTRSIIGRARVAHQDLWNMAIRYLLLPMLPWGYKREQMQFTHNADGLDVAYRVVDRQRYAAPPWPAIDFQGNHTEATGIDGVISQGSISVRMIGQPGTAKKGLLMAAIAVAESRIGKLGSLMKSDHEVLARHIQITDILQENVVELAIQFDRHKEAGSLGVGGEVPQGQRFANVMFQRLGLLPSVFAVRGDTAVRPDGRPPNSDMWGGDVGGAGSPDPYGYEGMPPYGVFAQYFQDGCYPVHMTPDGPVYRGPPFEVVVPGTEPAKPTYHQSPGEIGIEPPPPVSPYEDRASEDHKELPYTGVEVKTDYFNDYGWVALPFMKDNQVPEDGDVVLTKLHATTCRKNVFVAAKRIGTQPKLPKFDYEYTDDNGIRYVLDEFHTEFTAPRLVANGLDFEYEIAARLVYLMSRGLKPEDNLTFGSLPWDNTTKAENKVSINVEQQDEEMV